MESNELDDIFFDPPPKSTQTIRSDASAHNADFPDNVVALNTELSETRNAAFQAMMMSSELGVMLRFLQSGMATHSYDSLSLALFEVLNTMQLKGALHIFIDNESIMFSDSSDIRPLEAKVFHQCQSKKRIIDFGSCTIFNQDNCSLLIRNMPLDNIERYGMLRDNLCILLDVIQHRVMSLYLEQKSLSLKNVMDKSLSVIQDILLDMDTQQREFTNRTTTTIEDMLLQLKGDFSALNLDFKEEQKLTDNLEAGSDTLAIMFEESEIAHSHIRKVLEDVVISLSYSAR